MAFLLGGEKKKNGDLDDESHIFYVRTSVGGRKSKSP